ncbi:MAG: M20/M25/M40 family metallo-hydrolase [Gammaproteobacteria bacterium]|nr:M20/M25/M40 family metallo-hydrolase [Gammaproteobacteria bacterium]
MISKGYSVRPITTATLLLLACMTAMSSQAKSADHDRADAQALDLAKRAIALRSVHGPGNQVPQVAALFKSALVAGGFNDADVTITPVDDTAFLIARWKGADPKLKPLVISGHMDVVEANPADWQRDPFTPVVENGLLYGRGASDMKLDDALAVATLIELKREGYKPRRGIVLAFSGDEETTMKTTQLLAKELANAEMVLNVDGTGGELDAAGKPQYFTWSGAEKTYGDFQLTVTSPGGHSSRPYDPNAINHLAAALVRIGQYKFKPELSELTRAYFTAAARYEKPDVAAAMRAFAADPTDSKAIEVLRANPGTVGKIGTTCVATMVNGGHAANALPQRATANINCRIFPGHPRAQIMEELRAAAADPAVQFKDVSEGSVATDASPIRPDLVDAVTKAIHIGYPGVPVFPTMSAGASDSMWFRNEHIPSYGVSPLFIKESDRFSHGLNERVPTDDIQPAVTYLLALFTDLSE